MSLDVTFGTPGSGSALPPPGLAGPVGSAPPASDLAALFAALLANSAQTPPAPPGKAAKPAAPPTTEEPAREPSRSPDPPDDDPAKTAAPSAALMTILMALTAPPPLKMIPDKPTLTASPVMTRVGDASEITKQTTQEAMDTIPAPVPSALSAKTDTAGSELLPRPSIQVTIPPALFVAPDSALPVVAQTVAALPSPVVGGALPVVTPPVATFPAAQIAPSATVPTAPDAPPMPPPALSLNDIRPDAPSVPAPMVADTSGIVPPAAITVAVEPQAAMPVLAQAAALKGNMPQAAAPASIGVSLPLSAQVAALAPPTLQNGPAPANNTGKPLTKVKETPSKREALDGPQGQPAEFDSLAPARVHDQAGSAKQVVTVFAAAPRDSSPVSEKNQPEEDAGKATEPAKVAETVLTAAGAEFTAPTQKTSAPQSVGTALTASDRAQVMRQISEGAQEIRRRPVVGGVREMNLQLHPHGWGQIKLSVRMTPTTNADGTTGTTVTAHVIADNPAVKAALETHTADLRQTLQEAGLKLDRLSVTVPAPDASSQFGSASQEQRPSTQDSRAWTGQGTSAPNTDGAGPTGNGSGFGGGFASSFGDGRGGQTGQRSSPPASGLTKDTGTPETMLADTLSRQTIGRWDSRA